MTVMDKRLSSFIKCPEREILWRTMPQCFQFSFGKKTTVIIDCFEVFIDRPSNLLARAQTFSSYKHHNTVKVLIGITPQGTISFVAWGGRTSDKFLTENCGIMEKLLPGDLVMADRGFTIHESLVFKQAELAIPAFTRGKDQLPFFLLTSHHVAWYTTCQALLARHRSSKNLLVWVQLLSSGQCLAKFSDVQVLLPHPPPKHKPQSHNTAA